VGSNYFTQEDSLFTGGVGASKRGTNRRGGKGGNQMPEKRGARPASTKSFASQERRLVRRKKKLLPTQTKKACFSYWPPRGRVAPSFFKGATWERDPDGKGEGSSKKLSQLKKKRAPYLPRLSPGKHQKGRAFWGKGDFFLQTGCCGGAKIQKGCPNGAWGREGKRKKRVRFFLTQF